jgi:hypothetical protein
MIASTVFCIAPVFHSFPHAAAPVQRCPDADQRIARAAFLISLSVANAA